MSLFLSLELYRKWVEPLPLEIKEPRVVKNGPATSILKFSIAPGAPFIWTAPLPQYRILDLPNKPVRAIFGMALREGETAEVVVKGENGTRVFSV